MSLTRSEQRAGSHTTSTRRSWALAIFVFCDIVVLIVALCSIWNAISMYRLAEDEPYEVHWDDTYASVPLPWRPSVPQFAFVDIPRIQHATKSLARIAVRNLLIASVQRVVGSNLPLTMVRLERMKKGKPIWQCCWIVRTSETNATLYTATCGPWFRTNEMDMLRSFVQTNATARSVAISQFISANSTRLSLDTFYAVWTFLERKNVWRLKTKCDWIPFGPVMDDAPDPVYFLSAYSEGKSHQAIARDSASEDFTDIIAYLSLLAGWERDYAGDIW